MRRVFHYLLYVADVVRLMVVDAFRTCWQQSIRVFAIADVSGDWDKMALGWGKAGWAPPEGCLLKCNGDSTCFEQEGAISLSIVEDFTINEVLSWLKSLAFDNVVVESDYLIVILALSHSSSDFSELGVLLYNCLLMKNQFQHLYFCWTCRCANKATRSLA
ncbi:hypothetical protein CXB51_011766 [Gossypium anomalum]|uniref:RNase H type-1 domain-containing protein n=1 Tax=Gossypium anomalum TaxID=47600 RepID=A0A8J5YNS9_9ROSI|nr:hypothetical protein CXB51_011766 [Gossypium anomalum]